MKNDIERNQLSEYGLYFSLDFYDKVASGELVHKVHCLQNWIDSLSVEKIEMLSELYSKFIEIDNFEENFYDNLDDFSDNWEPMDAIYLIFLVYEFEIQDQDADSLSEEEIANYVKMMFIALTLETNVRRGTVERTGKVYLLNPDEAIYRHKGQEQP